MWENCIQIAGRQQIMKPDCAAAISDAEASAIIDSLRTFESIEPTLTAWMSTVGVVIVGLTDQKNYGQRVIDQIGRYLEVD